MLNKTNYSINMMYIKAFCIIILSIGMAIGTIIGAIQNNSDITIFGILGMVLYSMYILFSMKISITNYNKNDEK